MSGRNPSVKRQAARTPERKEAERFVVERRMFGLAEANRLAADRAALATQPATSQEGEACEHEAYLVDTADQPTRCVDCGASVSDLAATPTPPTLSEDLRALVLDAAERNWNHGPDALTDAIVAALAHAQVKK